jgi:hypothetical protein
MADDTEHALFSASSASKWMACNGALALEKGRPNTSSEAADEGTAAHTLAAWCLESDSSPDAEAFRGRRIDVGKRTFEVDAEMVKHINTYVQHVLSIAEGHELLVEQRVDYSRYAFGAKVANVMYDGESRTPGELAFGTSDSVILRDDGELVIIDLKYGANPRNRVDAEDNPQLMLYALGAYDQYSMLGDFDRVRMIIVQPRLEHVSEWVQTVEELEAFALKVQMATTHGLYLLSKPATEIKPLDLNPGPKQCHWCRAKAICPAVKDLVGNNVPAVADDFDDLTTPRMTDAQYHSAEVDKDAPPASEFGGEVVWQAPTSDTLELIEMWIKAQRAEIERRLFAGETLADWKVVPGKKGNRAWSSKDEAETLLKGFRLKTEEMYDFTVISPTTAEKLSKAGTIGPRQWAKAQELITQSEGKPSVAPASDKRPGISVTATADDFDVIADDGADLV